MKPVTTQKTLVTGVIVSGGKARRMGGQDKGLVELSGKPMIEYVIETIKPQVNSIIINANRNLSQYKEYGYPVISDDLTGYHGPLAGIVSCMQVIDTLLMLSVPCDSPFVPNDLVERLYKQLEKEQADISVAHDGNRMQPVFSLIKTECLDSLLDFLNRDERKIDRWYAQHKVAITDFSDKPETFININKPEDINQIESENVKT